MDKLAIFDVDYTITDIETQFLLLKYLIKKDRNNIKEIPRAIKTALMFKTKRWNEKSCKEYYWKMLKGRSYIEMEEIMSDFFNTEIKRHIYKDAIMTMRALKKDGYRIILSSASPDLYIKYFEKSPLIEKAMGSVFEFKDGFFTGNMLGYNNKGQEKVSRLLQYLKDEPVDWSSSLMFSDSMSDAPLLRLVGKGYLINSRPNSEFEVLSWK